jgi:anaphase-promoting complex subunit 5
LDYLHRFFDHTVDARPAPAPPAAAGQAPQDAAAAAARERGRMQSAALSLGSMHAQFGHIEEAMQALNETVGGRGGQGRVVG